MITNPIIYDNSKLGVDEGMMSTIADIIVKELDDFILNHPKKNNFTIDDLHIGKSSIVSRDDLIVAYSNLVDLPDMNSGKLHKIMNSLFIEAVAKNSNKFLVLPVNVIETSPYWWVHYGKFKAVIQK